MPKIIIYLTGNPKVHGYKKREFIWSEDHRLYLYGGREYEMAEFNATFEKANKNNYDLMPKVMVVGLAQITTPVAQPQAVISTTDAMTLEKAEEVLKRLAPERLKKKTGPKPQTPDHMEVD